MYQSRHLAVNPRRHSSRRSRGTEASAVTSPFSPRHELVVGTLGDAIPRAYQRLELRERRVHLPGHGGFLRLFPDNLAGQLLEVAQHGDRKLDDLDFPLELRPEPFDGERILRVRLDQAFARDDLREHDLRGASRAKLDGRLRASRDRAPAEIDLERAAIDAWLEFEDRIPQPGLECDRIERRCKREMNREKR